MSDFETSSIEKSIINIKWKKHPENVLQELILDHSLILVNS